MPKVAETPVAAPIILETLLAQIAADYPDLSFVESMRFSWHAGKRHVSYKKSAQNTIHDVFALLHELGHALLAHTDYVYDIELLQLEVAAWDKARELAEQYGVDLDEDHVQDCLDTYRDWLHLRATCPGCFERCLQSSASHYHCWNCGTRWSVTRSRLCRPYRLQTAR
ncbi:MAG TPA: hypothetical protein VLF59_00025 [Candidatus Saccharimonadales bacterium]|nr:hypothetical protein [Candidatus Saccharimonadales bacterium]